MSHKPTTSTLSTIPFSWEMIPGVPKFTASPAAEMSQKALAPPPPVCFREPIKRSASSKLFWREEDPFVAAFKECSKDYKVNGEGHEMKKRFKIGNKVWGSKSFLWCRCSFDVEEGNLRTRPLPSTGGPVIPGERVHGLIRMQNGSLRK